MYMSIFKLKSFWLMLVSLLGTAVICIALLFVFPLPETNYIKAFYDKEMKLKSIANAKKIIFIGGSNLAFGLHSDMVHQAYPEYKVINMGLNAGTGLKTMIDQVQPYIGKDDVIIITPEYEQFSNLFFGNSAGLYLEVLIDQPRFIKLMSIHNVPSILEAFPSALQIRAIAMLQKALGKDAPPSVYKRDAFNEYGDVNSHTNIDSTKLDPSEYADLSYKDVKFRNKVAAISYIKKFMDYCSVQQARMYIGYPVFLSSIYHRCKHDIQAIHKDINAAGIEVLYTPEQSVYADTLFLDTTYHLLYRGSAIRTADILKFMQMRIR